MPTYTYSGLHPRDGTIPVHTFYSGDGGKPVVAMKSSIVIDGQSLQRTNLKEVIFMLHAFQHFNITDIHKTNQDYDYALLVENLENDSVPDQLVEFVSSQASTYTGILIDHNTHNNTYTMGCGPHVFTNVISEFSCTDPSSEFPSVEIQTSNNCFGCTNICDYAADITCMMDCICKDLSPSNSCSTLHDLEQCTHPAAEMPLEQIEASSTEILQCRSNQLTTEYLDDCQASGSSAYSPRDEFLMKDREQNLPRSSSSKPDLSAAQNESPLQAANNSYTLISTEDFEAFKPTISAYEKRHQTVIDEELTVTISNNHTFKD